MKAFSLGRNESGEEAGGGGGAWARLHSITRSIDVDYRQNTLVRQPPDDDERLCTCAFTYFTRVPMRGATSR